MSKTTLDSETVREIISSTNRIANYMLIYYHEDKYGELERLEKLENGDFIDLYVAQDTELSAGDFKLIPFGISAQLPKNHWAQVVPRSSTFKNYGLIMTNGFGVIDESYCGQDDEWFMPVYATRDTKIHKGDRIAQFRLVEKKPKPELIEIDHLSNSNRGGFGSTGR